VLNVHSVGTWLSLVIVAAVGLAIALSFALNEGADDVRQQVRIALAQPLEHPRTPWGPWLSERMTADVPDLQTLARRADELDHRADRIRELSAAASLGALVLMLVTANPPTRRNPAQAEPRQPSPNP
jgi:hypothetical protein